MDPNVLKSFIHTYMKLLRNEKAVGGLLELIDSCTSMEIAHNKMRVVNKLHHKKRIGKEMRLTA